MMWERNLDQAIQLWLDPLNDDMRKHGGEDLQECVSLAPCQLLASQLILPFGETRTG